MQHAIIRATRQIVQAAAGFVYPPCCPLCATPRPDDESEHVLWNEFCATCREVLTVSDENFCRRCGVPLGPYVDGSVDCMECRRRRFAFRRVIRLGVYTERLRQVCIRCKESGAESLTAALAHLIGETRCEDLTEAGVELVVPVPQYWIQRMFRRHNAAATLAEVLARTLKVEFSRNILRKVRLTPDQSSLPSDRRVTNLRDAFRVRRGALISGRTVLLVDDILTTGTTANECARVLRQAGAQQVVVAVAAVVPKGRV